MHSVFAISNMYTSVNENNNNNCSRYPFA